MERMEEARRPQKMYRSYGLNIYSDIPLPDLEPTSTGRCDVAISVQQGEPPAHQESDEVVVLSWDEVGTAVVSGGTRVSLYLRDGVDDHLARLPILGPVLGTILRQRGRIVLHASAVSLNDGVVAFIGHKRYGKSTTAAALHLCGHPLVTDDVLPIRLSPDGAPRVWGGCPRLRLWPDAIEALGRDVSSLEPLHERVTKRALPGRRASEQENGPLALSRIYVLGRGDSVRSVPLSKQHAFVELLRHSYCSEQLSAATGTAKAMLFQQYTALAAAIPVHRLERPNDLRSLSTIVQTVEQAANGASSTGPRTDTASASASAPSLHA